MFDFLKSFWDKANGTGGGFTPKGIIVRLSISIAASLIASVAFTTFIRSDESDNQSMTPITVLVPVTDAEATTLVSTTVSETVPQTTTSTTSSLATDKTTASSDFVSPIASNPKDGLYLLNDILKPKDWSKFTGGTCPVFVSLVLADSIRLFKWSTDHWIDYSELLKIDNVGIPLRVKSIDVTNDGNIDYLYEFENPVVGGPKLGAVFAQKECSWHWIDVADRGSISRTTPYLNHDSAYLSMVDPNTGQPFIVNYNQLIDRFEVVR
jgi:hypothetical protein